MVCNDLLIESECGVDPNSILFITNFIIIQFSFNFDYKVKTIFTDYKVNTILTESDAFNALLTMIIKLKQYSLTTKLI